MAYTNVWNDSLPLDTQAANQGAADFRNLKLDVMQRVASFGAGTFANRPTPEVTSANADWTGVTYLATDTQKLYCWNGTTWDDISSSVPNQPITASNSVLVTTNNPATNSTYNSASTPINVLKVGSIVDIYGMAVANVSGLTGILTLQIGTTSGGFSNGPLAEIIPDSQDYTIFFHVHGIVTASGFLTVIETATVAVVPGVGSVAYYQSGNLIPIVLSDAISARFDVFTGFTGTLSTYFTSIEVK